MAVGHTDDATKGFGTFGLPNEYYGSVSANLGALVTIGNTSNNSSRDINQGRYDDILEPCEAIDDYMVTQYHDPIETKKQSIQQLGHSGTWIGAPSTYATTSAAINAIAPIYQESHTSLDNQACSVLGIATIGGVTASVGAAVSMLVSGSVLGEDAVYASGVVSISTVGSGTLVVQDVSGTFVVGSGATSDGIIVGGIGYGPVATVNYTGMTRIREDVQMITKFPNLEPANSSADNPWEGDTYPLLDSSSDGVGYGQTYFKNAIDTGDNGGTIISGATNYGIVYTSADTSANNSIDTLDSEVVSLRVGVSSYVDSANVLKPIKIGYAVNIWSYDRGNSMVGDTNTKYQNAINILQDPTIGGPY